MCQFLRNFFIFLLLPFIFFEFLEAILPISFFTHRHFEAIKFQSSVPHLGSCYPNINSEMDAVGDLCHHTKFAVIKKENWKTDELGYRNEKLIKKADVLLIGDSFVEGSSLSQNETITYKLEQKLPFGTKVYNMAPSSMFEFDRLLKTGIINKPKLLIFSSVEREIPLQIEYFEVSKKAKIKEAIRAFFCIGNWNVYLDKVLKQNSIEWLRARLNGSTGRGVSAINYSNMFFLNGINQQLHDSSELKNAFNAILGYKAYCDSLGINFLYLPMPDKETVYYQFVPFAKQPDFLFKLDSLLKTKNINSLNTLNIYNEYLKNNSALLYHLDDTHWNSNSTEIIATELATKIKRIRN